MNRYMPALSFLVTFAIFWFLSIFIHEGWHYGVSSWTGGEGYCRFPDMLAGWYHFTTMPVPAWPTYLAGGIGAGLTLLPLWLFARWSPTQWDMDDEAALFLVIAFQFGYGLGEMFLAWSSTMFWIASPVLSVLFISAAFLVYIKPLLSYLKGEIR